MESRRTVLVVAMVVGLLISGVASAAGGLVNRGRINAGGQQIRVYHNSDTGRIMFSDGTTYPRTASNVVCIWGGCWGREGSSVFSVNAGERVGGGTQIPGMLTPQPAGGVGRMGNQDPTRVGNQDPTRVGNQDPTRVGNQDPTMPVGP